MTKLRTAPVALLGEIVRSRAGKTPSKQDPLYWDGNVPWVTAKDLKQHVLVDTHDHITDAAVIHGAPVAEPGDTLVLVRGMTLLKDVPVGLVTRRMSFNQDVRCLRPMEGISGAYLSYFLSAARPQLQSTVTTAGHGTGRLDAEQLLALPIRVPSLHQQDWLAQRLSAFDHFLGLVRQLIGVKNELRRGLLHEMLTGKRRFLQYGPPVIDVLPQDWRCVRLGDVTHELSMRNVNGLGPNRTMGVIKGVGLAPMRDHVRAVDLRRYKVVPPNAFAYNPMRLNIGSIARSRMNDDCLVSPDYIVFASTPGALVPAYLDHLRESAAWSNFVAPAGTGSVRVRIYYRDLAALRIPLPPLDEQVRIATTLDAVDHEIELLESLRDARLAQKRSLMQKLLSGEVDLPDNAMSEARDA